LPRQSNGTYVAPANTAAVSGGTISSSAFNTLETDIGTEITNSVDRSGRSAMTAALPMGGNKITGLADPVALTDAATRNYILQANQQSVAQSYANTGTVDALTCAATPTITALTNGMTFFIRCAGANATTTPTFAPDAIAAAVIVKGAGVALAAGDIAGAGYWASLTYDSTLTKWVLNNPATGVVATPAAVGFFRNLSVKVASNTTVTVAADAIVTSNGSTFQTTALSGTINLGTNGVANALDAGTIASNTFYYIWAIAKADGTTAGLASTSSSAPTLPSGYAYKARIGTVKTASGSAQLMGTWQLGRTTQYVVGLGQTSSVVVMTSGIAGNVGTPTWAAVSVSNFVPPTAARISLMLSSGITASGCMAAPNNSYGGNASLANMPPMLINGAGTVNQNVSMVGQFILESTNVYYASSQANALLGCMGWEENL
jgi:hypothetical protein